MASYWWRFLDQDILVGETAKLGGNYGNGYRTVGGRTVECLAFPLAQVEKGSSGDYEMSDFHGAYPSTPTKFDGLKYFLDNRGVDGAFPQPSDPVIIWCDPCYPRADDPDVYDSTTPCFQVGALWNGNRWKIGYKFRILDQDHPMGVWPPYSEDLEFGQGSVYPEYDYAGDDAYLGIDPNNITDDDHERYALYFDKLANINPVTEEPEEYPPINYPEDLLEWYGVTVGKPRKWVNYPVVGWDGPELMDSADLEESPVAYYPYAYGNQCLQLYHYDNPGEHGGVASFGYDAAYQYNAGDDTYYWGQAHYQGLVYGIAINGIGHASVEPEPEPDPEGIYSEDEDETDKIKTGDDTHPNGFDGENDPNYPIGQKGIIGTGLGQIFLPEDSELQNLADYLWSDDYHTSLEKWGLKPMDQIISFGFIPFKVSNTYKSHANIILCGQDTQISMTSATRSMITFPDRTSANEINVPDVTGTFLDYTGVHIQMYIPFVGFVPLKPSDVLGKKLGLRYYLDLCSGECLAVVYTRIDSVSNPQYKNIGYYSADVLTTVPLTGADYASYYSRQRNGIIGIISDVVDMAGQAIGMGTAKPKKRAGMASGMVGGIINDLNSIWDHAEALASNAPDVQRCGSFGNASAYMAYKTPYLLFNTPKKYTNKFWAYNGAPTYKEMKIGDCEGFVAVAKVIDDTVAATAEEKSMIHDMLKNGVYITRSKQSDI